MLRKTEEYNIKLTNDTDESGKRKSKEKISVFEVFEAVVAAFIVVTVIFTFFFRIFNVDGPSMRPTLENGEKIVVSTIGYKAEKGDVIVLSSTEGIKEPIVKRLIAVGGDVVDINFTTGVVTVNGIEEEYTDELTNQQFDTAFPIKVPDGKVFVLGDNRGNSLDSRSSQIGCVDERLIVGKVLFKILPPGKVE